jgi:hypothetical protein
MRRTVRGFALSIGMKKLLSVKTKGREKVMKGYKALLQDDKGYYTNGGKEDKRIDWRVGKRVTIEGELKLCENGIHFFRHLAFAIDYLETGNAIAEIEVHGNIVEDTHKACTNDIKIVRIIPVEEIKAQIDEKNNG